jgi:hypothetical protein
MKKNSFSSRMKLINNPNKIPDLKLLSGSIKDKYPVILDGGKTTIFISDKSKEAETRLKYAQQRENRIHPYSSKNPS